MTSLELLVNKEKNQVIYAESDNYFVDILFSFLTKPLGSTAPRQSNIGCLDTLHKSLNNLDSQLLRTSECRNMLLSPRGASEILCKYLKVNSCGFDPTYYLCPSCTGSLKTHSLVSTSSSTLCRCGVQMSRSVQRKSNNVAYGMDGLFVEGNMNFLITDDLQVSPVSTMTSYALLKQLGVSDATVLEVRRVNVDGYYKVSELLTSLLISKTPLTDVFLGKQNTQHGTELNPQDMVDQIENDNDDKSKRMNLKLLLSKSSNKVLYAESGEEFPDLLLSFLTFPLGSVVKLLGGKTGMGCLDNLYKSVQDLSLQDCMKSEARTTMLLAPKLAPYFGTKNQLLKIEEQLPWKPILFHCTGCESYNGYYIANGGNECPHGRKGTELSIVNPKCRDGAHEPGGSFVAGPAKFVVTDELTVQRLSPVSGISLINKFSFPISDLEEVVVSVGEMEALSLLRAFLKSKTVLSDVFYSRKSYHSRKRSSDHEMSETDKRTRFEI